MYNHQLDAFIKVAETGSFSKAAEAMNISAPALLQQVNLLEDRHGLTLFNRTNHGVTLTASGRSLYEDAKSLIRFSEEAVEKARRLSEASDNTIRIGTSLLYKCRLLPSIWSELSTELSSLRMEILPMNEYQSRSVSFSQLGDRYDIWEGIYADKGWKGKCSFLELQRTPLCCAVREDHPFAGKEHISIKELKEETLMMPIKGVSSQIDTLRRDILRKYPQQRILDSSYYGLDTFAQCRMNGYVLITSGVYKDIHADLITIPIEGDYQQPYGLIYSLTPSKAVERFIRTVKQKTEAAGS